MKERERMAIGMVEQAGCPISAPIAEQFYPELKLQWTFNGTYFALEQWRPEDGWVEVPVVKVGGAI
jgi:hypothetical protein